MLLANFNRKEHLRHRAVSLRQHGFLVNFFLGPGVRTAKDTLRTCPTIFLLTGNLFEIRLVGIMWFGFHWCVLYFWFVSNVINFIHHTRENTSKTLALLLAQDYNRGFGIIRHNIPKVAANNSFGILRNLTTIRYDTIGEFNVEWKAEYSALSSTRSQKKKLKQPKPVPL